MSNRFMISVAALALIAGTGFANAQDTSRDSGKSTQQMQHSQGTPDRGGAKSQDMSREKGTVGQAGGATKSGEEKSSGAMKDEHSGAMNKNATDETAGAAKGEHAQGQQDKSKSMSQDTSKSGAKDQKDMKAEGSTSGTSPTNAEHRPAGAADSKSSTTTGHAGASATAAPPPEKKTALVSAIQSTKIEETTNVNFNVSVGATIPASVHFHPLPARIVEIYPEWRGYDVIFVHGQCIIVSPQTREIVYIIEG